MRVKGEREESLREERVCVCVWCLWVKRLRKILWFDIKRHTKQDFRRLKTSL